MLILNQANCADLYEFGSPSALFAGMTKGNIKISEVKKYGNFGMGAADNIKGEVIIFKDKIFLSAQNGKTSILNSNELLPYAQIITFNPLMFSSLNDISSYRDLSVKLDNNLKGKNYPYAIYIHGKFTQITLRSRRPPENGKIQVEKYYVRKNITGDIIGFWFPSFLMNIGIPSYHLHFISTDQKVSGHVIQISISNGNYAIKQINNVHLIFPKNPQYRKLKIKQPNIQDYLTTQISTNETLI